MKIKSSLFVIGTVLLSFTYSQTFLTRLIQSFSTFNLSNIEAFEKEYQGEKKEFSGLSVSIGHDYYPNVKKYDIGNAHIYQAKISDEMSRRGEYFFSSDSILRVALFNYFPTKDISILKTQFETLEMEISNLLGKPDEVLNSKETQKDWFNTSRKWKNNETMNAYLALTGSNKSKPYRLRLVMYKD